MRYELTTHRNEGYTIQLLLHLMFNQFNFTSGWSLTPFHWSKRLFIKREFIVLLKILVRSNEGSFKNMPELFYLSRNFICRMCSQFNFTPFVITAGCTNTSCGFFLLLLAIFLSPTYSGGHGFIHYVLFSWDNDFIFLRSLFLRDNMMINLRGFHHVRHVMPCWLMDALNTMLARGLFCASVIFLF